MLLVFSGITGANVNPLIPNGIPTSTPLVELQKLEKSKESENKPMNIEAYVRNYFADLPIMAEVARCETHFRHYDKTGEVIRGEINRYDVGVMQINEKYHLDRSKKLGIDIHSLDGNLEYAKVLYSEEGVKPWFSSSGCWAGQIALR